MADISKIKLPDGNTHDLKDSAGRKEAYLEWGGKNFAASYAPIDAAMVPELGANRLALLPAANVAVEYSRDGGSTWTDYSAADSAKTALFSEIGTTLYIGKADSNNKATGDYQLRVTITTDSTVYTVLNKFVVYMSTNGSSGCWCSIDRALKASETTFVNVVDKVPIAGWSGYNVINTVGITTYGNVPSSQNSKIRFTFGCTSGSTTYVGMAINKIMGFGGVGWTTPNTLAKYGRIYTYDWMQNVTFPANVNAHTLGVQGQTYASNTYADSNPKVIFKNVNGTQNGSLTWTDYDSVQYPASLTLNGNQGNEYFIAPNIKATGSFYGNLSGNVTGSVTGNVSGTAANVTGTVAVANGGTGKTNGKDAANYFMNALDTGSSTPVDADYYISQYVGGGTTTTTYHRRPVSALWEYIKGKISSILGLTATNYGGTSAKATADASGNTITSYYAPKSTAVTNVALATNKITKTINGSTTDVVTAATTSSYGITKLNTATNSTSTTEAATPSAVKTTYDLANTANGTANTALSGVNGSLIYDHTYTISNGVATFTPHVYCKGEEVTSQYAASCFSWKYRLDNNVTGTPSYVNLTTDSTTKGCTVTISTLGYGGHVIGTFTPPA